MTDRGHDTAPRAIVDITRTAAGKSMLIPEYLHLVSSRNHFSNCYLLNFLVKTHWSEAHPSPEIPNTVSMLSAQPRWTAVTLEPGPTKLMGLEYKIENPGLT